MSAGARAAIRAIEIYRAAISPTRPPSCRYSPTCSASALEAVQRYGLARGTWLATRRLLRCHPFHRGGYDPVPVNDHHDSFVDRVGDVPTGPSRAAHHPEEQLSA